MFLPRIDVCKSDYHTNYVSTVCLGVGKSTKLLLNNRLIYGEI